jgi:type IV pilus assembly protein PilC
VGLKQLSLFTRQLSTLISAGLPLVKALYTLRDQLDPGYLRDCVSSILSEVEAGEPFSQVLSRYPKAFPPVYVNMVRAAEQGGLLDEVLKRLTLFLEKEDRLRRRVRSAFVYPIFVLSVAVIILGLLMIFVVPTFTNMFADLGGELPLATKILIALSDIVRYHWYLLLIVSFLLIFAFHFFTRTPRQKYFLDKLKLRLPVFGNLFLQVAIANFSRTLGTLLHSGVPILAALETVQEAVGNRLVSEAISKINKSVKEGEGLSKPMESAFIFPPIVIRMVAIGEESGQLDNLLIKIADDFEEEVDVVVSSLTSILEPALIVFMGLIVGFIVIAMFLPLFTLGKLIG